MVSDKRRFPSGWDPVLRLSPNLGNIAPEAAGADILAQKPGPPEDRLAEALSGVFNVFAIAIYGRLAGTPPISFSSWNARAPLQCQRACPKPKLAHLKRLDFTRD
eukprot:6110452-Pyramimonas_sp.AAC.1